VRWALLATCAAAALASAAPAGATNECRALKVCIPVAGPWVLANGPEETQYQLACPRGTIVAGLDAELTNRAIDVVFRATLGSPVNPGVSTSHAAVFLARLAAGHDPAATFRPHLGCIPTSGGGQRVPTVYAPGRPTVRRVTEVPLRAGTIRFAASCGTGEHLVSASHAIAFYSPAPPAATAAADVHVTRALHGGSVRVVARAGPFAVEARAVVQLDLVCAGGG